MKFKKRREKMKLSIKVIAAVMASGLIAGCASIVPVGAIYTGVQLPVTNATGSVNYNTTGTATCKSILCLVAWGDASIKAAAENGKITKVNSVDYSADSLFGIYGKYTTTVYGD